MRLFALLLLCLAARAELPPPGAHVVPQTPRIEVRGNLTQRILVHRATGQVTARITSWQFANHAEALTEESAIAAAEIAQRGPQYRMRRHGRAVRYTWVMHDQSTTLDVHRAAVVRDERFHGS